MKKTWKKLTALLTSFVLAGSILAACGSSDSTAASGTNTTGTVTPPEGVASSFTFFSTKGEIYTQLLDMVGQFEAETGIHVEIISAGAGESPYTKITTMYNAGNPPTMAMLDTTDIIALGESKALDLSDEEWVGEAEDYITKVDGKVYSFPFCVEGRGIIYNKTTIEEVLGTTFDPSTITTQESFEALLQSLRDAGMENPFIVSKEDWSLGAHQLQYIYETYDGTNEGTQKVIDELKAGTLDVATYDRFDEFISTFDLLKEYNYNSADPLGAVYEQDPITLVDGDAALWFNGTWAWPNLLEAGAENTDEYGFLPYVLTNDTSDFANTQVQASASKQILIDKVVATPEEQAAAKMFLNWLVYEDSGQKALVEDCALISAFQNNPYTPVDPLGLDLQTKMTNGDTFVASAIVPGDHWSVLGAAMQKYLAGQSTQEELAKSIQDYWAKQS